MLKLQIKYSSPKKKKKAQNQTTLSLPLFQRPVLFGKEDISQSPLMKIQLHVLSPGLLPALYLMAKPSHICL